MSQWFRINSDMLTDFQAQRLSNKEFRRAFLDALEGKESPLSKFIRGPYTRPLAHEWKAIRTEVFARDDYTCASCGAHGVQLECDHIVPVARGGAHNLQNLTTACRSCNRSKRDKLVEEWAGIGK